MADKFVYLFFRHRQK